MLTNRVRDEVGELSSEITLEGFIRPVVFQYFMIRLVSCCKSLRVTFQSATLPEVVVHAVVVSCVVNRPLPKVRGTRL
jgi:hypothetical protein